MGVFYRCKTPYFHPRKTSSRTSHTFQVRGFCIGSSQECKRISTHRPKQHQLVAVMQRLTSVILGVAFLSFTASSVYAQSGSRSSAPRSSSSSSSGSSSSGSSSSATGGGGSSSGSGFGSTRSSGRYGLSAAERAAAQRTQAALVNSQINLLLSLIHI